MKKILVLLMILAAALFGDATEDMLNSVGDSGGMAGGVAGIGAVHLMFWLPMLLFFTVAGAVIFFYIKQFKQKDDGLFKTIAFGGLGLVLGIIAYTISLKVVDGLFDSDGCGKDVVRAYLKDSINKGLKPDYEFGTNIRSVSCLNSN